MFGRHRFIVNKAVNVVDYYSGTNRYESKSMSTTFGSLQRDPKLPMWPTYGSRSTLWKLNCPLSLVQMHSSECIDRWSNWKAATLTLSVIRDLHYSNRSIATRKLPSAVHTWDRWAADNSASCWGFRSMCSRMLELYNVTSTNIGQLNSCMKRNTKCETVTRIRDKPVARLRNNDGV